MRYSTEEPASIDERGKQLIESAKRAITTDKSNPNRNNMIEEAMNAMYDYFSTYSEDDLNCFNFQLAIFEVEQMLEKEFLELQSEPIFTENDNPDCPTRIITEEDAEKVLTYIVHQTRRNLAKHNDLKKDPLEKQCIDTSYHLEKICAEMGIEAIHFGVEADERIKYGMFHHFTVIRISLENGMYKNYIADCTYRQFFTKTNSNIKRIGVMRGPAKGCSIGAYMMMTEKRKKIAETILQKGYIEITPEVIKEYFDAIVYSSRDKSYYSEHGLDYTNPDDVIPEYTVNDYLQMLVAITKTEVKSIHVLAQEIMNQQDLCPTQTELNQVIIQELSETEKMGGEPYELQ